MKPPQGKHSPRHRHWHNRGGRGEGPRSTDQFAHGTVMADAEMPTPRNRHLSPKRIQLGALRIHPAMVAGTDHGMVARGAQRTRADEQLLLQLPETRHTTKL